MKQGVKDFSHVARLPSEPLNRRPPQPTDGVRGQSCLFFQALSSKTKTVQKPEGWRDFATLFVDFFLKKNVSVFFPSLGERTKEHSLLLSVLPKEFKQRHVDTGAAKK